MILCAVVGLSTTLCGAEPLDDPMRPPLLQSSTTPGSGAAAATREQTPLVSSILISPGHRSAVIAGKSVKVGERVNGMEVVAIEPTAVTVRRTGKLLRLPLHSLNVKTPAQVSTP